MASPVLKKRKLNDGKMRISAASPPYFELMRRPSALELRRCSSFSSDHDDHASVSCCSSNGSSEERTDLLDLEVHDDCTVVEGEESTYYSCRREEEERSDSPMSELRAESPPSMAEEPDSRRCKSTAEAVVEKKTIMPSELEIEDFFAKAEKEIQQKFIEKYNFDIVKDQPLEGRYEWVKLSP